MKEESQVSMHGYTQVPTHTMTRIQSAKKVEGLVCEGFDCDRTKHLVFYYAMISQRNRKYNQQKATCKLILDRQERSNHFTNTQKVNTT